MNPSITADAKDLSARLPVDGHGGRAEPGLGSANAQPSPRVAPGVQSGHDQPWEHRLGTSHYLLIKVLLALGCVVLLVDPLLAKPVFDVVVNSNELVSWLVALSLAGASMLASVHLGMAIVKGKTVGIVLMGLAWVGLGLAVAILRLFSYVIIDDAATKVADQAIAGVMFLLYLAGGGGIIYSTMKLWDPIVRRYHASRRAAARQGRTLTRLEPQYARVSFVLAQIPRQREALARQHADHFRHADAVADELKDRARIHLVGLIPDPASASLYKQPKYPEPDRTITIS